MHHHRRSHDLLTLNFFIELRCDSTAADGWFLCVIISVFLFIAGATRFALIFFISSPKLRAHKLQKNVIAIDVEMPLAGTHVAAVQLISSHELSHLFMLNALSGGEKYREALTSHVHYVNSFRDF